MLEGAKRLSIPKPASIGVIMSYKCTSECGHCMYACSPRWRGDWMSTGFFEKALECFGDNVRANSPRSGVGLNFGLHFTGGEPFLNYALLLEFAKLARAHGLNSNFVETNCFWCTSEKIAEERFAELKENGLGGVLVSVNPFLAEFVPFENAERAIRIGREIFGGGLMVYHPSFYRDMVRLRAKGRTGFGEYLKAAGAGALASLSDAGVLLPMGRLVWRHGSIFERFPPERFFHENCLEELTRRWHAHVDNYGNYISGYCAGLSLGRLGGSGEVFETGIDLDEHPVLKAVASSLGELFDYAKRGWGFKPNIGGYVSKCHLCLDVRKHLVDEGSGFEELSPGQFYDNL